MDEQALESFSAACGLGGPLLLEVEDRGRSGVEPVRRSLAQPFALVGRGERMDLTLDHWQVSRRQAYVQVVAGRIFCADLGGRVAASQWVGGPVVYVGPCRIRVVVPEARGDSGEEDGPREAPVATLEFSGLEFAGEAAGRSRWSPRDAVTLVGGAPECALRIIDPAVSKFDCSLVRTTAGLWVVDLLGRGGVAINGERLRYGLLRDGDELRIASSSLRVRYGDPASAPGNGRALVPFSAPIAPTLAYRPPFDRELTRVAPFAPPRPQPPPESDAVALQLMAQFEQMQQQMFDQFNQMILSMAQAFGTAHREQMASVREELDQLREITRELQELQARRDAAPPPSSTPATTPAANGSSADPEGPPLPSPEPASGPAEPPPDHPGGEPGVDVHAWINQRINALQAEQQGRWQKLREMVFGR